MMALSKSDYELLLAHFRLEALDQERAKAEAKAKRDVMAQAQRPRRRR